MSSAKINLSFVQTTNLSNVFRYREYQMTTAEDGGIRQQLLSSMDCLLNTYKVVNNL